MNRDFTSKDARALIERHEDLLFRLQEAEKNTHILQERIRAAAETLIEHDYKKFLKEVSVEEIGTVRKGIRVKTLAEHGIRTIADVLIATPRRIAAIRGISDEAAGIIKRAANTIADRVRREMKIQLSADDKNSAATALVQAVSAYKRSQPCLDTCRRLSAEYGRDVRRISRALKPSTGAFRWLFSSKETKQRSVLAYEELQELTRGEDFLAAEAALTELKKAGRMTPTAAWADFTADSIGFYTILEEVVPGRVGGQDDLYGLPEDLAEAVQGETYSLEGLTCTLRRYQELGVRYILHQRRVLLGDEMGLGKTVQAIASLVALRNEGATHFAVVCPAGVLSNWCREIGKHSDLTAVKIHGADKAESLAYWMEYGGVAVTTYETTGAFTLDKNFRISSVVVDEAHYIKNPEAKRTVNTKALCSHAERLLFMTGTALENRVEEMIELISILQPRVATQVRGITFMASAPQFREKVAPVYYRRRREDVLTELPELIENRDWCSMTRAEERAYDTAVLQRRFADARRVSWNVDDLTQSSKALRLVEIAEAAEAEERKVIVFSFFLDTIAKVGTLLADRCYGPINGSVPPQRRQEIIDAFDGAPAGSVLLAQIQSGGTGLNIQSASVVVICEPQFKPSIENQAISRAYRMGQARNVLVHRLLCEDTIDERITDLLEEKQALFDAFADKSVAGEASLEIDEHTFGSIIHEEYERVQRKSVDNGSI